MKRVHDKIRDHICDKCGFVLPLKGNLKAQNGRMEVRMRTVSDFVPSVPGFAFNRQNPRPWLQSRKLAVKTAV